MSPRERRAMLLLLALGVVGHLAERLREPGEEPLPPVLAPESRRDPVAHRERVLAGTRPLAPGETIDVDRADAVELRRLPGVGPSLAARIVADREERGPFGSPDGLDRVPGIGPAILARLRPHLRFSGVPAEATVSVPDGGVDLNRAGYGELLSLPGIGPARARAILAFRDSAGSFRDLSELARVPGIPAAVAGRLIPLLRLD